MTAWIALVLSIFGLLWNLIKERDKLISFLDELKTWNAGRVERQRALAAVRKFAAAETANSDAKLNLGYLAFYLPVFLISVISSSALSYLQSQSYFYNTILLSSGVYLSIALIVSATFLATYRRAKWQAIVALFIAALLISALWGIFVIVIEFLGLRMMASGISAGIVMTVWLWIAEYRDNRRLRKTGNTEFIIKN